MARFENDWDRDRHDRDRWDQDRDERERDERRPRRQAYTGWAGRGFNQGSFGEFGGQGSNLFAKYGGQGFGAQHGYRGGRREAGGGMGTYTGRDSEREYDETRSDRWGSESGYGQGSENWNRGRENRGYSSSGERDWNDTRDWRNDRNTYETRDRDREEWGRDWGGQGFSGREGGWGGYGSYDRENASSDRDRGSDQHRDRDRWGSGSWSGGESRQSGWSGSRPYGWGGSQTGSTQSQDWSRRGQFSGRGPKGWQRSDDRIREDVSERLSDHPDVDASGIEVTVQNGEVTLHGEVGDRDTKRLAEDLAERVSGVRDVHNQIRVNRGFWASLKDAFTGENEDDNRRDRSGQPETMTGDRVSTPTRAITPSPEMTAGGTGSTATTTPKETTGTRK